jgi:hypothetical protein
VQRRDVPNSPVVVTIKYGHAVFITSPLNPVNGAVTLSILQKAAVAAGREIYLELVSVMYKGQK